MKHIRIDTPRTREQVQAIVSMYAAESGISIVGYYQELPLSLTLLRWPDLREGYQEPTLEQCNQSARELSARLNGTIDEAYVLGPDEIHTMMGRQIGGYDTTAVASLEDVLNSAPHMNVSEGYMISARLHNNAVESYGEPVAVILGNRLYEDEIHAVGDELQQHHYVIERSTGQTDFYETKWAS